MNQQFGRSSVDGAVRSESFKKEVMLDKTTPSSRRYSAVRPKRFLS